VLAGVLIFMTSGADAALPVLLHLSQPPPCPHCSMRGCRCGPGCCDTKRCRRPVGAAERASVSHHHGGEADAAASGGSDVAINPRCAGSDRDALPPASGGRPALIVRSESPAPPAGAASRFEFPGIRPPTVPHEPPTPPPRTLA
jgi:hypothetical protein